MFLELLVGLGISELTKALGVLVNWYTKGSKTCKENNKRQLKEACKAKWRDISYANVEHMNGLTNLKSSKYVLSQANRVDLRVFKSVESTHGCVIVLSRDTPAHGVWFQVMLYDIIIKFFKISLK